MKCMNKKILAAVALLLSVAFFAPSAMAESYCKNGKLYAIYRDSDGHIIKITMTKANICQLSQLGARH